MSTKSTDRHSVLTPRVLLAVLLLAPINCYFLIQMELVRIPFPTWVVPLSNVIFILVVVLVINAPIRATFPGQAIRRGELLLIYVMLSFATTLAGCDVLQAVLSVLGHSFWLRRRKMSGERCFGTTSHDGSPFRIKVLCKGITQGNQVFTSRTT